MDDYDKALAWNWFPAMTGCLPILIQLLNSGAFVPVGEKGQMAFLLYWIAVFVCLAVILASWRKGYRKGALFGLAPIALSLFPAMALLGACAVGNCL